MQTRVRGVAATGRALFVTVALAAPAAEAADHWLVGDFCSPNGEERMIVEMSGLGFNEHTVCTWNAGPPSGDSVDVTAACANVYLNGEEVVRMDERTVRVEAARSMPDEATVTVAGQPPATWRRCTD